MEKVRICDYENEQMKGSLLLISIFHYSFISLISVPHILITSIPVDSERSHKSFIQHRSGAKRASTNIYAYFTNMYMPIYVHFSLFKLASDWLKRMFKKHKLVNLRLTEKSAKMHIHL